LDFDVAVLGGGNAALCAAIAARDEGARVVLLERAPRAMRGGNTRHTRDIRHAHSEPDRFTTGVYDDDEFMEDLLRVTGGATDRTLAALTIRESRSLPQRMGLRGVLWQKALRGTLHLSRTNRFFLGGGKALVNAYYDTAAKIGVEILYDATARNLIVDDGRVSGIVVDGGELSQELRCRAAVVATGGFEANVPWLKRYWGEAADGFVIRGTPYNDGAVLAALFECDAKPVGDPRGFHAVAVDARAPKFDGGIVTRIDVIPFGIVVNRFAKRFYDEGEDFWPKRYAIWGGLIAEQPGQVAYAIFDAKVTGRFIPTLYPAIAADSLAALAEGVDLEAAALIATVAEYNAATRSGTFAPDVLDDCVTSGIAPAKSHWALPIDTPPYYCYPARPGITFTYLGVAVDERARVLHNDGMPFANLYAAGECMAGNILGRGYLAGFGLTIGSVFGRIAGKEASRHARV